MVQDMGNTCRECLVMVLVFWLLVNGREIGEQAAERKGREPLKRRCLLGDLGRLLNGF